MAISVKKLSGEPVIVAAFEGDVSERDVVECVTQAAELSGQSSVPMFRVVELQNTGAAYSEIAAAMLGLTQGAVGAAVMPETTYLFVGKPQMGSYFAERGLPFFTSASRAIGYVQTSMGQRLAS